MPRNTFRRVILAGLLPLLAGVTGSGLAAELAAGDRPNLLLIFTDDQSHRSVGCYDEAHPWVKTPNIDRLADEGIRFEYAKSQEGVAPTYLPFQTRLREALS